MTTKPIHICIHLLIRFFMTNCSFDKSLINSCSHREIHEKVDIQNTTISLHLFFLTQVLHLLTVPSSIYRWQLGSFLSKNCTMNNSQFSLCK